MQKYSQRELSRGDMRTPHLDILRRQKDGSFIWIEAAANLSAAEERLSELARTSPGEYFVFDQMSQQIVAKMARQAG